MEFGTDPNRATPRARRLLYRDPVRHEDLCQVVLMIDDSVSTNTRVPSYKLADVAGLCRQLRDNRVRNIKIFAQDLKKTSDARQAIVSDNLLCRSVQEFRSHDPDLFIAVETCLCPYTENGSCGLHYPNGQVDVSTTRELFGRMAVLHAQMGVDAVGPASMIGGTVAACREALDENGFGSVTLMPHLIFRSPFYALYRSIMQTGVGESRPAFQIDPFNDKEWFRTIRSFVQEGASIVLLEPGLFILDLIASIRCQGMVPLGCFSASGEYELLKHGARDPSQPSVGALEFCRAAKRAGADFIVTYAALEVAELLSREEV